MRRTPSEKLERLKELAQEGLPDRVIGERLAMSPSTVRYLRRLVGVFRASGVRQDSYISAC